MPHKAIPTEFPKAYDPKQWEDRILNRWDEADLACPESCIRASVTQKDAPAFSIVLPPPNVTGTLHIGHAAMLAIQDTIVRFKRMSGYRTLWLPGTDHAAIATESKVEKLLREQEGKSRQSLGRTEFLKRVEQFALDSHNVIVDQVKRLGSSVDWSREAYTLDKKRSLAVRTAFKRMYDAGLIYRGNRIVNWDPVGKTTISDDEVVYKEETAKLYYLKYGPFEIATARPETKFGDKYVVMHPEDARYHAYQHGQKITVEWINGPIEAIIIKDAVIDLTFGTGVMTITPWHSVTDFELAEKHGLDMEPIIDLEGKLLPIAGEEFAGLPIHEAREKIIAKLQKNGLVTRIEENYLHTVATAERTGAIIEPQVMRQWFIGVNREFEHHGVRTTLKQLMQQAVRDKQVVILPERFEKNYFHWIDHLRDWCISRQIWFGHRIPVWYRAAQAGDISSHSQTASEEVYCGIEAPTGEDWKQDPDTLDTWFSSGLWTFSTLGWPTFAETAARGKSGPENDFANYHPTALLETGYDILFFWVARMILLSEYLLGTVPFRTVYLHGLVRDERGRKMSKSLGNTINPLDIADTFGADALRLALITGSTPGNDMKVGHEKITNMRNVVNKLWNIGRYVAAQPTDEERLPMTPADHWILLRFDEMLHSLQEHLEAYQLSFASSLLQDFTWNELADWYLEIHKVTRHHTLLRQLYALTLRAWHPLAPFVTEALQQSVGGSEAPLLMGQPYPQPAEIPEYNPEEAQQFSIIIELIQKIRQVRATYRINPKETLTLTLIGREAALTPLIPIIQRLGHIDDVLITSEAAQPKATASISAAALHGFVHLGEIINIDQEKARLTAERMRIARSITAFEQRLMDKNFRSKAPAAIIAAQEETLAENTAKLAALADALNALS